MENSLVVATRVFSGAAAQNRPISTQEIDVVRKVMLADNKISLDEARFLGERLRQGQVDRADLPALQALLTRSLGDNPDALTLQIGKNRFTQVKAVAEGMELAGARAILDENKIDEIYLQTPDGKLFIAHGPEQTRGALDLDGVKAGYVGKLNEQKVTVLYVDDETNTIGQGAIAPIKATGEVVKTASENGIIRGISEMAGWVTAIFVGSTVLQNGLRAVTGSSGAAAPGTPVVGSAAPMATQGVAQAVTDAVVATGKVTTKTIARGAKDMIKSGLRTAGVVAVVGGVVVGGVALILGGIGAVKGALSKPKTETIDMATDQKLDAPAGK